MCVCVSRREASRVAASRTRPASACFLCLPAGVDVTPTLIPAAKADAERRDPGPQPARVSLVFASLVRCLDTFWLEQRCLILSDFFCRRPSFATLRQLRSDAQRVEMRLRAGQAKSLITSESSTRSCSTDSDHQRVQHSPLSDWLGSPASPALAAV